MSTKTLRKRIALVAVSALTAGVLSVMSAPVANAAIADVDANTFDIAANAAIDGTVPLVDGSESVGICADPDAANNTVWATVGGQIGIIYNGDDVLETPNDIIRFTVSGDASIIGLDDGDATDVLSDNNRTLTITATGDAAGDAVELILADDKGLVLKPSGTAGSTVYVTVESKAAAATSYTVEELFTINIVASCASNAVSVADSFISVQDAAGQTAGSNVDDAGASRVANAGTAYVSVALNNAYASDLSVAGALEASATNGVIVNWNSNPTLQVSTDVESDTGADDVVHIQQGTANKNKPVTSVVTIKFNGTIIGSKTIVFTGDAATITVSGVDVGQTGVTSAAAPNDNLGDYVVKDSAGNQLANLSPVIDDSTYNGSGNIYAVEVAGASSATAVANLKWSCTATSSTDAIKLKLTNTAGTVIYSGEFTAACGGAASTYTASLDKAVYTQGSIATLTIVAKDASGFAPFKGETVDAAAAIPAIAGAQMTPVAALATTDVFDATGTKTYTFTVGTTSGSYSMAVNLRYTGNAALAIPYTVSGDGSVSNADVLKSIVALIASINKQIQALQKLILRR